MTEWLNENEGRAYPLVDSSKYDIPDELLVDMVLSGPLEVLEGAYLQSLVVRGDVVSVVIAGNVGALAAYTSRAPQLYRPYAMTQLRTGIGGYVTFGVGIDAGLSIDLRNLTTDKVMVDPGCLRGTSTGPVTSVGKYGTILTDALNGIVNLSVGPNVTIAHAGSVITLGLSESARKDLLPQCERYAIFGECGTPPIRRINGVCPDEDGNIILEFDNG